MPGPASSGLTFRHVRTVPPAAAQGLKECGGVLGTSGLSLHQVDQSLLVVLLGTQQGQKSSFGPTQGPATSTESNFCGYALVRGWPLCSEFLSAFDCLNTELHGSDGGMHYTVFDVWKKDPISSSRGEPLTHALVSCVNNFGLLDQAILTNM